VYLHGAGNRSPTRLGGGAHAQGSNRVSWPMHQSEPGGRARRRLLVRGGDLSCEAKTCREDPSCRELVGDAANWLGLDVLPVWVLTEVLSLPHLESWP
jgi:hypothetical protein